MNQNIKALDELGQSLWYDNMRRGLLDNGEIQSLIQSGTIRGITSNPTIFEKAIAASSDYDDALRLLVEGGADPDAIYLALVEEDISRAAVLLRPVYEQSMAVDGYVSLEVAPQLAHDTEGTVREALRLAALIHKPNLMVKVPGTAAGVPAIRELTAQGLSINVTLLFSLSQYEAVAMAYLEGLEQRVARGLRVSNIASVASFFVSRVDTLIDKRLKAEFPAREEELRGRAAVANARLAYALGKKIFSGPRWEAIAAAGGRPQRLLWASTGTKDPRYSDTLYVDELIGRDTVNTVPPATLDAFLDHGKPDATLERDLEGADELIGTLKALGIDLEEVGVVLQKEGVESFSKSMTTLMQAISERRRTLLGSAQ